MVDGHTHRNHIEAHARRGEALDDGFWEISTASHIDWPIQSRIIEIAASPEAQQAGEFGGASGPGTISILIRWRCPTRSRAPPRSISVRASPFTITADNVVPILLSTAYKQFDEKDQNARDDFLAHGTGIAFSEVMSGRGDSTVILDGLRQAASERRILIYSTNPKEQEDLAQTNLAGGLDENQNPGSPSIGVFLNDGTAAKLGYYLSNEVKVTQGQCRADGRRELDVAVTMHYDAPSSGLPAYVTGAIPQGQPYTLKTNVLAFAPLGGGVVGATRDGEDIGIGRGQDHLREVGTATIAMNPGTSTVVTFTVLAPSGGDPSAEVTPGLMLTPGVKPWEVSVEPYQPCSPVQN